MPFENPMFRKMLASQQKVVAVESDAGAFSALVENGLPKLVSYEELMSHGRDAVMATMCKAGVYVWPTTELVAFYRDEIGQAPTIEIGSGNGVIAHALGIKATDNCMQRPGWKPPHHPELMEQFQATLEASNNGRVPYGANVEELDAVKAVKKHRPTNVIGNYITHQYTEKNHGAGGNIFGVDEGAILKQIRGRYLMAGNLHTHQHKPILSKPHKEIELPGLFVRSHSPELDRIFIWKGKRR